MTSAASWHLNPKNLAPVLWHTELSPPLLNFRAQIQTKYFCVRDTALSVLWPRFIPTEGNSSFSIDFSGNWSRSFEICTSSVSPRSRAQCRFDQIHSPQWKSPTSVVPPFAFTNAASSSPTPHALQVPLAVWKPHPCSGEPPGLAATAVPGPVAEPDRDPGPW